MIKKAQTGTEMAAKKVSKSGKCAWAKKMNPCLKQFSETGWMPTHDAGKGRVE